MILAGLFFATAALLRRKFGVASVAGLIYAFFNGVVYGFGMPLALVAWPLFGLLLDVSYRATRGAIHGTATMRYSVALGIVFLSSLMLVNGVIFLQYADLQSAVEAVAPSAEITEEMSFFSISLGSFMVLYTSFFAVFTASCIVANRMGFVAIGLGAFLAYLLPGYMVNVPWVLTWPLALTLFWMVICGAWAAVGAMLAIPLSESLRKAGLA